MVDLTPEEKARILTEKLERKKARDEIESRKKVKGCLVSLVGLACLVLIIVLFYKMWKSDSNARHAPDTPLVSESRFSSSAGQRPPPPPSIPDLNAKISVDDTQMIITNNNDYDWANVEIELNGKLFSSGYKTTTSIIRAGSTAKAGLRTFVNGDGMRFDPYQMKPQKVTISASGPNGSHQFYVGGWQ